MFSHLARREVTCRSHATKGSSNSSKASSNLPTARLEVASIFFQKDQQHLKAWQRAVWRVEDQALSRSPTEHHSGHSTLGFHSLTLSCLFIDLPTFGPSSLRQVRNSTGINVRLVLFSTSPLSRSSASHGRAASLPLLRPSPQSLPSPNLARFNKQAPPPLMSWISWHFSTKGISRPAV